MSDANIQSAIFVFGIIGLNLLWAGLYRSMQKHIRLLNRYNAYLKRKIEWLED